MALSTDGQKPRTDRYEMPPNPSDPRGLNRDYTAIWQQIIPQVEAESKTEEEFTENMQRVLKALFYHQYNEQPAEDDWRGLRSLMDMPLHMYRNRSEAPASDAMPEVEPQDEEAIQAEKRASGLGHNPR